jgi:phytoene desaturase
VTLFEKNATVGGKMHRWSSGGYCFDTGPTLLTMPFVLRELFASVGRSLDDVLELVPLEPLCRYFFPDGSSLDASSDTGRMEAALQQFAPGDAGGFRRFLRHGEEIYQASAEPFLFAPFGSWNIRSLARSLRHLKAVTRLDAFRTLDRAVRSHVSDPRLQQLLNRFATYNGSSPFQAPATLAIIPAIEFGMGGWAVAGGMYEVARALERLAAECGAGIRTGCEVRRILVTHGRVTGVETADGETHAADGVVCNADAMYALEDLIPGRRRPGRDNRSISLAGFVLLLGIDREYGSLAHHNVFFSDDYRAEFSSMFEQGLPAASPTVYVSVASKTDPAAAPPGHSALFVLVNAPPLPRGGDGPPVRWDWSRDAAAYRESVLALLEDRGLTDLRRHIRVETMITPADFRRKFNAYRGSIYGLASNSRWSAFLRPPNRSRTVRGLYFAGGSTHPGGGIPLVLLSGRIAANLVMEDAVRT